MVDNFRGDIFVGQRGEELAESFGFRHEEDVLMVIVLYLMWAVGFPQPEISNCGPRLLFADLHQALSQNAK